MNTVDITDRINEAAAEGFLPGHIRTALMVQVERLDDLRRGFAAMPFGFQQDAHRDGHPMLDEMKNLSDNLGRVIHGVRLVQDGLNQIVDNEMDAETEIDWTMIHCTYECGGCVNGEFCEDVLAGMRGEDVHQRIAQTVTECGHDGECAELAGRA